MLSTLFLGHRWFLRRVQIKLRDRVKVRSRGKRVDTGREQRLKLAKLNSDSDPVLNPL